MRASTDDRELASLTDHPNIVWLLKCFGTPLTERGLVQSSLSKKSFLTRLSLRLLSGNT